MSRTITRFAPSPTGQLHLGHAFAAKVAHDLALGSDGSFLLRFEDIDHTRVRTEYYDAIEDDLRWLGLDWQPPALRQSARTHAYATALETLREIGVAYPCFCTRREIEEEVARMTSAPHGPEGALYPGTCRKLTADEIAARLQQGAQAAWRLDATRASSLAGALTFNDLQHGIHRVDATLLGDVILARRDIGTAYHLAVVVDDAFQQVTHVTRGEDLLPSTHVHRLLQAMLGYPEPLYLHHRLVTDENGVRLAKRHDALSLRSLREQGARPSELLSRLAILTPTGNVAAP
ncbi:MAG: tRNA glutamyl-Q(34) synthetase GluQRS [Verrucomicrobia bacterium]|nr:MAG: tRNA glutamyl-Q(34) synthetase GluQRS [Verrucomicrobiota bacterium]TAE89085.1 MAG: tRNA glutamyl-Q(34) synthetase GluQRS [Verrucomicrobiota bacterium]TAF28042.1 MAG: tRNA glutamyl-Q(34) synthetase GluQRS [Verrucomicrobiota bacterium]TAF42889.1 MAG: tRNA glutamyl-Q(34) synthetase GluQRS [Verrucomicrobiota bacterium]